MGKTFTAIGIVQETHDMGDKVAIIVYDTRESMMRTIFVLKSDYENVFSKAFADGTKIEMIISASTGEVERFNPVFKRWISTIHGKKKIFTEYNYRNDFA